MKFNISNGLLASEEGATFTRFNSKGDRFIPQRTNLLALEEFKISHKQRNEDDEFQSQLYSSLFNNSILSYGKKQHNKKQLKKKQILNKRKIYMEECSKYIDIEDFANEFYADNFKISNEQIAIVLGKSVWIINTSNDSKFELYKFKSYEQVTSLEFNEQGDLLVVGDELGNLKFFNLKNKKEIFDFDISDDKISYIKWKQDLFVGTENGSIYRFSVKDKKIISNLKGHKGEILNIQISSCQNYLASGGNDNKVIVWSLNSNHKLITKKHNGAVRGLCWSQKRQHILYSAGAAGDNQIMQINVLTQQVNTKETNSPVCSLIINDQDFLISSHIDKNNSINVWNAKDMQLVQTLSGHQNRVLSLQTQNNFLVSVSADQSIQFWKIEQEFNHSKFRVQNKWNSLRQLIVF